MLKAIDFFCGAGGLTRGLLDAGIDVVGGFDSNAGCRTTYERNNSPSKFIHARIEDVQLNDLRSLLGVTSPDRVLFAGCAPCQPFTKQRRDGDYTQQRTLLGDFARLIEEYLPGYVLIENVPGIRKVKGNSTYRRFLQSLTEAGYEYTEATLDAKLFGVPQNRTRWVVLASRFGKPSMPLPTHGPNAKAFVTVRDTIKRFPVLTAGKSHPTVPNHRAAAVSDINLRRLKATPSNGGGRLDWPRSLHLECHKGDYSGHSDVYGRMKWDLPAPTLTCKCFSISNGRYGHPTQHRAISLREAAALQSFGDNYVFYGISQQDIGAQIGNAVPVLMGNALGRAIVHFHTTVRLNQQAKKQEAAASLIA